VIQRFQKCEQQREGGDCGEDRDDVHALTLDTRA
jgi:hypothetical protein